MYASIASMELSHLIDKTLWNLFYFSCFHGKRNWIRLQVACMLSGKPSLKPRFQNPCPETYLMLSSTFTTYVSLNIFPVIFNICVHRCCLNSSKYYIHSTKIYWEPICQALLTSRHKSMLQNLYTNKKEINFLGT